MSQMSRAAGIRVRFDATTVKDQIARYEARAAGHESMARQERKRADYWRGVLARIVAGETVEGVV